MMNSVIKGAAYVLVHAPDLTLRSGTTQTAERALNPDSGYLASLPGRLRKYGEALGYPPNQVFIGNLTPESLAAVGAPWYEHGAERAERYGEWGEIMPQDEFYLLMQACDAFDLVCLEKEFAEDVIPRFQRHPLMDGSISARLKEGVPLAEVEKAVRQGQAEGLYQDGRLAGCVKKAHESDENLAAHIILENLASKASCVLALLHLARSAGIDRASVDLVLDCSEEACGDRNQRGGGNMAKAAAEIAGYAGATGADVRAFCAAPVHALIHAAALTAAGTYDYVAVAAGGSVAKLGMNGKDHLKKGLPVLEDVLGGFAALIGRNDGVNPEILSAYTGKHTVGAGSSPQAAITALVADPLDKLGLKITDIDKYAAELQNPEITRPAGAGDVPLSNYKLIGALAVKRGEIDRADLDDFPRRHGLPGWAPTQGHIPSGAPYLGFARKDILAGGIRSCMIIGKGSLFLGRMTGLFDGVSLILRKNSGAAPYAEAAAPAGPDGLPPGIPKIAVAGLGGELGEEAILQGALSAAAKGISVVYIGSRQDAGITAIRAEDEMEARAIMERLLADGGVDGAVAMHYPFPIGVSTVGRAIAPGTGKAIYIAATTGSSAIGRAESMVYNAIYGLIAAKACGVESPSVGILNVDGARRAEAMLKRLQDNGYPIAFAGSRRPGDDGALMRGNDLLAGTCDVLVTDSLTGNLLIKLLGASSTGGAYETAGFGYGPGIGRDYRQLVMIVSRASGAPVIAGALAYAAELIRGDYRKVAAGEFAAAEKAGLTAILAERKTASVKEAASMDTSGDTMPTAAGEASIPPPSAAAGEAPIPSPKETVTGEIYGMEITDLEEAVTSLWKAGIYAEGAMGCTGPVILVNETKRVAALAILCDGGWLSSFGI